jgi:carboxylesterase type B
VTLTLLFSVDILVTSMPKNPPFRAAIMESGQSSFYINPTNSPASWLTLAAALNCTKTHPASNLTCLRAANASTIKSTIEHLALAFTPVADNVTMLRYPEEARVNKSIARVPVLSGTNANEGTVFTAGIADSSAYLASVLGNQTTLIQSILAAYPITPAAQLNAIVTDLTFTCPAAVVSNDSHASGFPTWRYYFNTTFANTQLFPGSGVYHSSEIPLVWGTYPRANATVEEHTLSQYMQKAWARFAQTPTAGPGWTGVPNVGALGTGGVLNTTVGAGVIDRNCHFYRPYYNKVGIAVQGGG